jgi:ankyrin repeat protein
MYPNPQDALPLPPRPNLEQYKKLAKELVKASADRAAIREWAAKRSPKLADEITEFVLKRAADHKFALSDAQFVIARIYGFASWPKFAKHVAEPRSEFERAAEAIIEGDAATLKRLLRKNPKLIRQRSEREHQSTLLHYISANGVEGYRQKSPKNAAEIAKILLDAGAEVDAEADVYGGGATPLGLVATSAPPEAAGVQNELMQVLLDHGAAIEHPTGAGNKHKAVIGCLENGRGKAAAFLAERGAELDVEGAAGVGRLDVVKKLIDSATDKQIRDGFAWACQFGHTAVVDFLLQNGAGLNARLRHNGQTGLHWAAYGGHPETVKLLLDRGASLEVKDETYDGTPIEWAVYAWATRTDLTERERYYEVVALLAGAGAKVDRLFDGSRTMSAQKIAADPRMRKALGRAAGQPPS